MNTELALSQPLILEGYIPGTAKLTKTGEDEKKLVLDTAKLIPDKITSQLELSQAEKALKVLQQWRIGVGKAHEALKAPVIKLGREIDEVKKTALSETDAEETRIKKGSSAFQQEELQKARAAEAKRQQEAAALAQKQAQEAAQAKARQDEADRLAKLAEDAKGKKKTDLELQAAKAAEEAEEALLAAETAALTQVSSAPVVAMKGGGREINTKLNFRVKEPIAFIEAWEQFWIPKPSADHENEILKLDRQSVLDQLNLAGGGLFHKTRFPEELPGPDGMPKIPGCEVYEEIR